MSAPNKTSSLSWRRLIALCRKESYQIVRDPSSILVAFILPVLLLFVFGYAVNLDITRVRLGLINEDGGAVATRFQQALQSSNAFTVQLGQSRARMMAAMEHGEIRGLVIVPNDFSVKYNQGLGGAVIQVLADGAEPNTASFVTSYVQGIWQQWQIEMGQDHIVTAAPRIDVQLRSWFNPSTVSRNFLVPGSISVVMTIIGALLTSLVVAREWERGTMEALLATPVTRTELLLSKFIPYYLLGIAAMFLCWMVTVWVMGVPFRGSLLELWGMGSLFLGCALGLGLFLSTVMRNQFNAAQAALMTAYLPALMLSGFIYDIDSMPKVLQWITLIIPARYFASELQTLFQAGMVPSLLLTNAVRLLLLMLFWIAMTALKTRRTLE